MRRWQPRCEQIVVALLSNNYRLGLRMDCSGRCVNKYFSYFCSVHQLSQWKSCTVGGPLSLCLSINWVSCLKRLRTPGLLISGNQKIREVMATLLLCKYKHLLTLLFRVVTPL